MLTTQHGSKQAAGPTLLEALLAHRAVAALALLVPFLLGLTLASLRPVEYLAQAHAIAGATSVNAAAVPSFAQAGQSLAETYSRVFAGDAVQSRLRDLTGLESPSATASPVPGSSVILVESRSGSKEGAVLVADAGVAALVEVVAALLDNEKAIAEVTQALTAAEARLRAAEGALEAGGAPDPLAAAAAVETARAEAAAYQSLLSETIADSVQSNGVQPLASAEVTGSNGTQRFALYGAAGLLAGCVLAASLTYAISLPGTRGSGPADAS